jgi:predicted small lipoprotein YifL
MLLRFGIIVVLVCLTQGCGRKGVLYLPVAGATNTSILPSSAVANTHAIH